MQNDEHNQEDDHDGMADLEGVEAPYSFGHPCPSFWFILLHVSKKVAC